MCLRPVRLAVVLVLLLARPVLAWNSGGNALADVLHKFFLNVVSEED